MSQNTNRQPNSAQTAISTSRRRFLETTGFAGLLGFTASIPVTAQSTAQSDSPGAIAGLDDYIEAPEIFAENQEPPHVPSSIPFDSVPNAHNANQPFTELESRFNNSPYFELLNGEWDFSWYNRPAAVPDSYDDTDWESIAVPGCWQTQGYDTYVYLNTPLTWTGIEQATDTTPPEVPGDYNPVGVYQREFSIPADWDERQTFLNFEGVKQACFVWIDEQYVGYNQGSMTAAEFDVTEYISADFDHTLTVQVYRFSDGEALETQDMFRFSGIFRSVYLYSTPRVHLRDFFVRTELDEDYQNAELRVDGELANYTDSSQGEHTIRGHLFDSSGAVVASLEARTGIEDQESTTVSAATDVSNPELWSAEHPTLYTLVLEHLVDNDTVEAMFESVGFREYSVSNSQFQVNGQPARIRGVNSHEHHPEHGRTVPIKTVREDFELMKQHNVNALRASHYPRDPSAYYLANEYGLYVEDELNVETHWNVELLGQTDDWDAQALERFRRMVQSNKNHSSIFMWSTGNEAGEHDVHADMAAYVNDENSGEGVDPTRLLYHQDNADNFGGGFGGDASWADIFGPRYPSPTEMAEAIAAEPEGKPIVMGEYAHAMGNSGGLFHDFWEAIQPAATMTEDGEVETYDQWKRFQGGFVWDWVDQAVYRTEGDSTDHANVTDKPKRFYDGNPFCLNGVVSEDRTAQPELYELKKSHEPVGVTAVDVLEGELLVTNHLHFTDLSELNTVWQLTADDRVIQTGSLDVDLSPLEYTTVQVPFEKPSVDPGGRYRLTIQFIAPEATQWHEAGHEVAFSEFEVPFETSGGPAVSTEAMSTLTLRRDSDETRIIGDQFEYTFDESNGGISSAVYGETTTLSEGPLLDLYRAPIQNEIQDWGAAESEEWFDLGLDSLSHTVESVSVDQSRDELVTVDMETSASSEGTTLASVTYRYQVFGSGDIRLEVEFEPTDTLEEGISYWLPRVGVAMDVPGSLDHLEWYGRGPHETYPDRKWSGKVGRYAGSVNDQYVAYQPPSDNGNKCDVEWATFTDGEGYGLAIFGDEAFNLNIEQYSNLTDAEDQQSLEPRESPRVHVDHKVTGVGGTPQQPLEQYQIKPESMSFTIGLRPYSIDTIDPVELSKREFRELS